MDSARYFDLLGESVPQVRVSTCTLALLGFFNFKFMLTPFFLHQNISLVWALGVGALKHLTACPTGAGKVRAHLGVRCVKSTCNIFR